MIGGVRQVVEPNFFFVRSVFMCFNVYTNYST